MYQRPSTPAPRLSLNRNKLQHLQSGGTLKGKPLRHSAAIETRYIGELLRMVNQMVQQVEREVIREIKAAYALHSLTGDAADDDESLRATRKAAREAAKVKGTATVTSATSKFDGMFSKRAKSSASTMLEAVTKESATNLSSSLKDLSGTMTLKMDFMDKAVGKSIKGALAENAKLITNIPEQYKERLHRVLATSAESGGDMTGLIDKIKAAGGMEQRRAKNIALDQTRKAYNTINGERLKAVGVKRFEWVHSGGGLKPRESHIKSHLAGGLNGGIYELAKGAFDPDAQLWILPAQLPNCRCTMVPVIEDDDGVEEDGLLPEPAASSPADTVPAMPDNFPLHGKALSAGEVRPLDTGVSAGGFQMASITDTTAAGVEKLREIQRGIQSLPESGQSLPLHAIDLKTIKATQEGLNPSKMADLSAGKKSGDHFYGVKEPVVANVNGEFVIVDGHHRLASLKAAGKQTVTVRLYQPESMARPAPTPDVLHRVPATPAPAGFKVPAPAPVAAAELKYGHTAAEWKEMSPWERDTVKRTHADAEKAAAKKAKAEAAAPPVATAPPPAPPVRPEPRTIAPAEPKPAPVPEAFHVTPATPASAGFKVPPPPTPMKADVDGLRRAGFSEEKIADIERGYADTNARKMAEYHEQVSKLASSPPAPKAIPKAAASKPAPTVKPALPTMPRPAIPASRPAAAPRATAAEKEAARMAAAKVKKAMAEAAANQKKAASAAAKEVAKREKELAKKVAAPAPKPKVEPVSPALAAEKELEAARRLKARATTSASHSHADTLIRKAEANVSMTRPVPPAPPAAPVAPPPAIAQATAPQVHSAVPKARQTMLDKAEAANENGITVMAKRSGMKPAEYKQALAEELTKFAAKNDIYHRTSNYSLKRILESGRLKSQFEKGIGSIGGLEDTDVRKLVENQIMSVGFDIDPTKRPIYGYMRNKPFGLGDDDAVDMYGDIAIKMKPAVKERSTFTMGDSLSTSHWGNDVNHHVVPVNAPTHHNIFVHQGHSDNPLEVLRSGKIEKSWDYAEAQIHGGSDLSDFEHIYFPPDMAPDAETVLLLKQHNIPFTVLTKADL